MSEPVVEARGVGRTYRSGSAAIRVLDGLDLVLAPGELVAVVGASGVGKSTLLHILGLLDRPDAGTLRLEGVDAGAATGAARDVLRNRSVGFVFQFFHLVPELTALDNVLLPARIDAGFAAWFGRRAELRVRARDLLARVGLEGRLDHRPAHLSGGERQRVAIARALMNGPRLLLCDEPTGNLDPETSRGVWEVLRGFRGSDRGILVVTHNEALAADADRVLTLSGGRLAERARAR
jgi:lipoprotein-releasing system ATP-binding protein